MDVQRSRSRALGIEDHKADPLKGDLGSGETLEQLLVRLRTTGSGLTTAEAKERLLEVGPNEPSPSRMGPKIVEFVRGSFSPLVVILLVAAVASASIGEVGNAVVISAIVTLSAGVGFWQRFRSERAVQRLQAQIALTATVRRDGRWEEIARREIVAGDVVRLSAGDLVPADARLVRSADLHVHQAGLTGESFPAEKSATTRSLVDSGPDAPELVFLGTSIVSGSGEAVVFATGSKTSFGDVFARLSAAPAETEFERGMRHFGMLILRTVFFLVLFILVVSIVMKRDALQSLLFAVALAVGLTPEFLPMITTVTLAKGAVKMARQKVIVKHLSAIQNLGSIDILCSDKTGTLTAGTMSLGASLDPLGSSSERTLAFGRLNSRFQTGIKGPLDAAILESGVAGADDDTYAKVDEIPFDFERRRLSVVVEKDAASTLITKGAPESMLEVCSAYEEGGAVHGLDAAAKARCLETYRSLSAEGFRVLAVATRAVPKRDRFTPDDERELTLLGFLTFADHLLDGVAESIDRLRRDGVTVKILTGDNELVSAYICRQAGIDASRLVLGSDLAPMEEAALARVAEHASVFARVSPGQKQRIIQALKSKGHVVGFLGDGINDAPSLHGADVGISVAGAVDIAREASDIILLERGLGVLHAGILAGRESFGNVSKYLLMGTSSNFGNVFSMAGAVLFLPFLPMLPAQILLTNFLYDLAQITIPTDRVDPVYLRRPHRWDLSLIRKFMLTIGPLSSAFDFLTFFVLLRWFGFGEAAFHTGWFLESLASQTLVLFVIRTARRPWKRRPSLPLAVTTVLVVLVGVALPYSPVAAALGFTPLPARYFAFLVAAVAGYLVLVELVKHRLMRTLLEHHRVGER